MQYYKFQYIFDEFSKQKEATKSDEHDIGKIREKFTEIINIVGINIDLLRKYKDEKTGKMVGFDNSNRQFCFPEPICSFCVEVLKRYTDEDFKVLRKKQYDKVPIETLTFLFEGFTNYLKYLGYDDITILTEQFKMDYRLKYNISIQLYHLQTECQNLKNDAVSYTVRHENNLYNDNVYFIRYMVEKTQKLRDFFESVHGNYLDLRNEECENSYMKYNINNRTDDFQQTLILENTLKQDEKYQSLLNKQMDILCSKDFVKNIKSLYAKITDQIIAIKKQHERDLFGHEIQDSELTLDFPLRDPSEVLYDAIKWTNETKKDQYELIKRMDTLTEGQKESIKSNSLNTPSQCLPPFEFNPTKQELEKRGIIKFPCCKEEIIVYYGASGCIVNKCPQCNKQVLFNLDDMSATIYEPPKEL